MSPSHFFKMLSLSKAKAKIKRLSKAEPASETTHQKEISEPIHVKPRLQLLAGQSIFNIFPNEIILVIIDQMYGADRQRFSQCSKLCHELAACKSLVLDEEEVAKYREGGSCAHLRDQVRTLRFQPPKKWFQELSDMDTGYYISLFISETLDHDETIQKIRLSTEALSLFPAVQELFISYEAPRDCEINILVAILSGMVGHRICKTLRRLEIQIKREGYIERFPESSGSFCWTSPQVLSFTDVYNKLSPENQKFFGQEENNNTVNERLSEIVPELPALREFRVIAYDLPSPMNDFSCEDYEGTAIYLLPLAFAPNLKRLCVETEHCANHYSRGKGRLDTRFTLDAFQGVTDLHIIHNRHNEGDTERIVNRFPHLQYLQLGGTRRYNRIDSIHRSIVDDYHLLSKLKGLEYIRLRWPHGDRNGVSQYEFVPPKAIRHLVKDLLKSGLNHLHTVEVLGSRWDTTKLHTDPEHIDYSRLLFVLEKTGEQWGLDMKRVKGWQPLGL